MFIKEFNELPTITEQLNWLREKKKETNSMIRMLERTQVTGYTTTLNGLSLTQWKAVKKELNRLWRLVRGW